jgi:hypothetical protein
LRTAGNKLNDVRIFIDPVGFPVAVYIHNDWEATELSYVKPEEHNTESLCRWCSNHNIEYRLLFPISIRRFIRHPEVYYRYNRLKARLGAARKEPEYE